VVVDHRQLEDWTAQVRRDPNRVGAHLRVIGVGTEVDVKKTKLIQLMLAAASTDATNGGS
jgi:hypothetical protein